MNKGNLLVSLLQIANRQVIKSYQYTTVVLKKSSFTSKPIIVNPHGYQSYRSTQLYCSSAKQTSEVNHTSTDTLPLKVTGELESDDSLSPNIKLITNGDASLEKKLQVLFLELEVFRQEGKRVPTSLHNEQWKEVLNTTSRNARKKYLAYLWGVEMKKLTEKQKKEEKRIAKEDRYASDIMEDDGEIHYGLNRNTIHMRIYDTTINQHYNNKLVQAIQFGQKIVVDCSYDPHMTTREALNAAKQITFLFSENRNHPEPFNLYLCNANPAGHTMNQLHRFINTLYEDHFPLNVTEKSYLDLFPKESLVYLTPHCRDELTTFDHDAIYIIGAMVDKVNTEPLSLAKAKKEGLKMAKLPLERYLNWGSGSGKSLTLNQMMLIMLEMKTSGDWEKALLHVPRRKLNYDEAPSSQYQAKYRRDFQPRDRSNSSDYQDRRPYHQTEHQPQDGTEYERKSYQNRNVERYKEKGQYQGNRTDYQGRNNSRNRNYFSDEEDEPLIKKNK